MGGRGARPGYVGSGSPGSMAGDTRDIGDDNSRRQPVLSCDRPDGSETYQLEPILTWCCLAQFGPDHRGPSEQCTIRLPYLR
jgi:hypothetical protein